MHVTDRQNRDISMFTKTAKKELVDITPFNVAEVIYKTDLLLNSKTFDLYTKTGSDNYYLSNDVPLIFRSFRAPRLKKLLYDEKQYEFFTEFEEEDEVHNLVFHCDVKYMSKEKRKKDISIYLKSAGPSDAAIKPTKFGILKNERKEDVGVIFVSDISRSIGLNGKSYWQAYVMIKPEYGDKQIDLFDN